MIGTTRPGRARWRQLGLLCGSLVLGRLEGQVPAVQFSVFSPQTIGQFAFVPRSGAPMTQVVFYPTARSPRYEYRGVMPVAFFDADSKARVAEASIPPEIREALLIVTPMEPAAAGALRYRIAVLDDGALRAEERGIAIVNLSGMALSGSIGSREVTLQAGLNRTIALSGSTPITLRTAIKHRTLQAYGEMVTIGRKQHALLLLFPPFYPGSPQVQSRLLLDGPADRPER